MIWMKSRLDIEHPGIDNVNVKGGPGRESRTKGWLVLQNTFQHSWRVSRSFNDRRRGAIAPGEYEQKVDKKEHHQ